MADLLPGTEVELRGLRWEISFAQPAGKQQLYQLRRLAGGRQGRELVVDSHAQDSSMAIRQNILPNMPVSAPWVSAVERIV